MLSIGREEKALHIKLTQTDVQVQVGPAWLKETILSENPLI